MFLNETERIKRLIEEGAGKGLTELQFLHWKYMNGKTVSRG